jgi:hypothetical protein
MTSWRCRLPLLVLGWLLSSGFNWACNVPVFRYALERWRSSQEEDRYQLVVFHRGPLAEHESKMVARMRTAKANVSVQTVDVNGQVEEPLQKLWKQQGEGKLPWMVLRYPIGQDERRTVWSGCLGAEDVSALLDSPARREIAQRLLKGDSVVWLLLESGDKQRDEAAADLLQTQLSRLEKSVQLPDVTSDDSVPLLSNLPLRLTFSLLRVRRDDPAEKMFVAMLLHTNSDLTKSAEPMVFPIFGRGRALDAMIGKGINAETLQDSARFLCGACSCQVKRLNPGVDLLIAADWDAILKARAEEPSRPTSPRGARVPIPTPKQRTESSHDESAPAPSAVHLPVMVALGMILAVGALAWRTRRRKGREA